MHYFSSVRPQSPRIRPVTELTPQQQPTNPKLKKATNLLCQWFPKHPADISVCHSLAEYLYCCLLEGEPDVVGFVPQPFIIWVGNRRYTPDIYIARRNGLCLVQELKPENQLPLPAQSALERFFERQGMVFETITNEEVFEREAEARHWLHIVQILLRFQSLDTRDREQDILEYLLSHGDTCVGDILPPTNATPAPLIEVALLRLLHQGVVSTDLTQSPLNFDSVLSHENHLA